MDGGVGCHTHGVIVFCTELMADTDCGGCRDAEYDHEENVACLCGNLVGR